MLVGAYFSTFNLLNLFRILLQTKLNSKIRVPETSMLKIVSNNLHGTAWRVYHFDQYTKLSLKSSNDEYCLHPLGEHLAPILNH